MAAADSGDGGEEKMVTVVSSDGARFEVREAAASLSQTVRRMMGEVGGGIIITLPSVDARTLAKVLEYCNKHAPAPAQEESPSAEAGAAGHAPAPAQEGSSSTEAAAEDPGYAEDLEWFDREFMRVDRATLFSLVTAANYLKVEGLLDLICQTVADMLKGKTTEQMREILGIENDFTPEEEEEVRREHVWAFH